jgi:uncharacterized integral membrane protein
MRTSYRKDRLAQNRSRLAFWLIVTSSLLGVLGWFLVVNRSNVSVILPFGFGTWNSPLSFVILASMAMGSVSTLMVQALFSARRCVKSIYHRWNQPRTDLPHGSEVPHIVSAYRNPNQALRQLSKENTHSD